MESRGCSRVQLSTSRSCLFSAEKRQKRQKREHELLLVRQAGKIDSESPETPKWCEWCSSKMIKAQILKRCKEQTCSTWVKEIINTYVQYFFPYHRSEENQVTYLTELRCKRKEKDVTVPSYFNFLLHKTPEVKTQILVWSTASRWISPSLADLFCFHQKKTVTLHLFKDFWGISSLYYRQWRDGEGEMQQRSLAGLKPGTLHVNYFF